MTLPPQGIASQLKGVPWETARRPVRLRPSNIGKAIIMRPGEASLAAVILFAAVASGCAAPKTYLVSEDYRERSSHMMKLGAAISDVRVLDLNMLGGRSLSRSKSRRCRKHVDAAIVAELAAAGYVPELLPPGESADALVAEYRSKYGSTLMPFAPTVKNLAGMPVLTTVPAMCDRHGWDGVMLVGGVDHSSAVDRMILTVLLLPATGLRIPYGSTTVDLALFDCSGTLVFYDREEDEEGLRGDRSLTSTKSAGQMYRRIIEDLVAAGRAGSRENAPSPADGK